MKKTIVIIMVLLAVFCSLYVVDCVKMNHQEPVVFSTWGRDYTPPVGISPESAIENVKQKIEDKNKETITNFDHPKIEEFVFQEQPSIYCFDHKINLVGKRVYKITFHTTQDGLLGPMVFYVEKQSGEMIGMDFRE